jgi:protein arginine kinase
MSWYNTVGACPEHVLYSKVRYVRNVNSLPFSALSGSGRAEGIIATVDKILGGGGFKKEELGRTKSIYLLALAEKQLIDADLVESDRHRFIYSNEPCNALVALGGDDMISISAVVAGLSVKEAESIASSAEAMLEGGLDFAYDDKIGYLSRRVEKCGAGMELSAALYLPSLKYGDDDAPLLRDVAKRGASLCPMFSFKDNAGDIYVLSYTPPFLCNENAATEYFCSLIERIVTDERSREKMLFPEVSKIITDSAARALGILSFARQLSLGEMLSLISDVRLAICLSGGSIDGLPELCDLNFMLAEGQDAAVMSSAGVKCLCANDCDDARASFTRKYIASRINRTPHKAS